MSVSYLKQQSLQFNTRSKKGAAGNAPSRRICGIMAQTHQAMKSIT